MDDAGAVVTVTGRVDPADLGVCLPHEHLFCRWDRYEPPESLRERQVAESPISLADRWWVEAHATDHLDNLVMDSVEEAAREVGYFRDAGGGAMVDCTPKGVGSDPEAVRRVARETGIDLVQGTAFYTEDEHPEYVASASVEELAEEFVSDVQDGIGDTDVRAGLVGEIGLSGHIHDQEEKVLRAGARAAARTGAPLTVHPPGRTPETQKDRTYPSSRWGLDVLDIVEEEGLAADRVVICHQDRSCWYEDRSYQQELAERGAYVEYDLFGYTKYYEEFEDALPSDVQRVEYLVELIEAGCADRLLLSQDVFLKFRRRTYGGKGYAHILRNVVPILRGLGVSDETIDLLLVENPARMLTFDEPAAGT